MKLLTIVFIAFLSMGCKSQNIDNEQVKEVIPDSIPQEKQEQVFMRKPARIVTGAEKHQEYLPLLAGKKVGIITNQTGIIPEYATTYKTGDNTGTVHLVDFLISKNIDVQSIFAPEHGFRGKADAGETVKDGKDIKTGLPIISLYGGNKKPKVSQIEDLDILLFDIQDVGARFYTYISTLHYVMEAAAENSKQVIVLDRPNPNGHYVDGPVLDKKFKSFVGMHPVPIVYGMTIGEYAQMINGEKWLKGGVQCNLKVIGLDHYTHQSQYELPVKPSPNLPSFRSVNLYPSTCFFEGANVSEGRGTNMQFQVYGAPELKGFPFQFTPMPNEGAKHPRFEGKVCYGEDLRAEPYLEEIELKWLLKAYENYPNKSKFWVINSGKPWIDLLAGTDELRQQIENGWSEEKIKATWEEGLNAFKEIREKYLLYP